MGYTTCMLMHVWMVHRLKTVAINVYYAQFLIIFSSTGWSCALSSLQGQQQGLHQDSGHFTEEWSRS